MSDFIFSTTKSGTTSLYESDGTAAGTNSLGIDLVSQPSDFTTFDNKLFFVGTEPLGTGPAGGSLQPLFSTNGTATGTVQLQDSPGVLYPENVDVVNGKLLVSGEQFISGNGIDVTSNGVDFTQINTSISAKPNSFAVSNGIGFFDAVSDLGTGSNHGLWRTDGTATGTFSINPTGVTLAPSGFTAVGGNTIFVNASANGADGTGTLWVTNGTSAGTHQIVDAALGAEVAPGSAVTNGKAVFTAQDAAGRQSIWTTNGTSAGTTEILVLGPASASIRHSSGFTAFNGKVIYTTGYDLAITDGTAAGTVSLPTGSPMDYVTIGSKIFIDAVAGSGPTLSVSDGTPAGTAALKISGLVSINSPLTVVGSDVVFEGTDTSGKQVLFESDGTTTGSKELALPAGITVDASTVIAALPAPATTPQALTGMLPKPLYTGTETVTGTGGVAGLQLERITQGTYNTPGSTGWVKATVQANGNWSAKLVFDKPGQLAHVYAQNGGIGAVVDLINGVPIAATAKSVSRSVAADMTMKAGIPALAQVVHQPSSSISGGSLMPVLSSTHVTALMIRDHFHMGSHTA